jgi:hypothetical protein
MVFDKMPAHRIAFDTVDTTFYGKGVKLAGRLVLPKGQGAVPIVVLVHGSWCWCTARRTIPAATTTCCSGCCRRKGWGCSLTASAAPADHPGYVPPRPARHL